VIGKQIFFYQTLDSTNNYIAKGLESGQYGEGDVIMAGFQTQGRGQRGNSWQAEAEKNLLMSTSIDVGFLNPSAYFKIAKAVSVAIISLLEELGVEGAKIKWPNDILISGQKVAGMLIETKGIAGHTYAIIGLGININQRDFNPVHKATSLLLQLQRELKLKELCTRLSALLSSHFSRLKEDQFHATQSEYMHHLYGSKKFIQFDDGSRRYRGRINDVGDDGVLLVKSQQGQFASYQTGMVRILY
jgi:BirA family biotin operon repressor/biotin-[acetyl-CoA-carboxylase] ligase